MFLGRITNKYNKDLIHHSLCNVVFEWNYMCNDRLVYLREVGN